jgi:hypothetical protein
MLAHQIDLGAAFSRMFTDNANSLANFDARLFLYSTASTTNNSTLGSVPTRNPASISSVPAPSDTATLAALLTKVQALKPADYGTSSKAIIESANTDIKTVSKDLRTINALIKSPRYMKNVTSTTTQATTTAR